jgi:hypothetical protein
MSLTAFYQCFPRIEDRRRIVVRILVESDNKLLSSPEKRLSTPLIGKIADAISPSWKHAWFQFLGSLYTAFAE